MPYRIQQIPNNLDAMKRMKHLKDALQIQITNAEQSGHYGNILNRRIMGRKAIYGSGIILETGISYENR